MSDGTEFDEREESLPKWARAKMGVMRMRLREKTARLHETLKPVEREGARVLPVGMYIDGDVEGPSLSLPTHSVVASDGVTEVSMRPTKQGIYLTARDSCSIYPAASNCFFVKGGRP